MSEAYRHKWDRGGERCEKCGDKDWMGGPCSKPDPAPTQSCDYGQVAMLGNDGRIGFVDIGGLRFIPASEVEKAVKAETRRILSIIHDHRVEDGPMLRHRLENAILNPTPTGESGEGV